MTLKTLKKVFRNLQLGNSNQEIPSTKMSDFEDIFSHPISKGEPPSIFPRIQHHQKPNGCSHGENSQPIQTNNFSNNLALGDQTFPIWTLPYSLWLTIDPGQLAGIAFNHTDASQRVFGPDPNAKTAQYYFNPPRIKSFVLSGENINRENIKLTLSDHKKLSITAEITNKTSDGKMKLPLVQGMGFITSIYENMKPVIGSSVGIQEWKRLNKVGNATKYSAILYNQVTWSIYVTGNIELELKNPNIIVGDRVGNAIIQIARGLSNHYDDTAGIYQESADLAAAAKDDVARYKFIYNMKGESKSRKGLVWCLPHHQESLVDSLNEAFTGLTLDSPTKGIMKAYKTNELEMEEDLPNKILWEPWTSFCTQAKYSSDAKKLIAEAATNEVRDDVVGMANIDSMYTSGKILAKYAYIAYVCHFVLQNKQLTDQILPKVKQAIEIFANNQQKFPLVYDTTWKGLISSADPGADFGNSNYNDHHFHYGYHIHAIALISHIDREWLFSNNNLVFNYANTLLRDTANPELDAYFPQFRSFDWFHGHSFAHGIFPSGDGKDEESSSEDYNFAYGMKLYANVIGDTYMERRANLMIAIMKRSMNMYMLYCDDNLIQPRNFIGNKVAGISFENKIDFATYFGRGTIGDEWIHGIHMLPITPISSFIRHPKFVKEEWDQKLNQIVDRIPDGWKGILMLNRALFDPKSSWKWFSRNDWNPALIDNGMSRTWSLTFVAGVGGEN